MTGRGHRQELGDPLDDAENDRPNRVRHHAEARFRDMIRDRCEAKKAVFFWPIRILAAIVKSVKSPVASNVCSGTLPAHGG
jgi:hypothetical protein